MSAWRFKRIFKNHEKSEKYEAWVFARLQDEVYSIKKLKFETIDGTNFAITVFCGKSFILVITLTPLDLARWYDDDIVYSIKNQLIQAIMGAHSDEFV